MIQRLALLVRSSGSVLRVAAGGILANRLRSVLTILGVIIGVASVIALLAVGEGARQAVVNQFQSLGTNVIEIKSHSSDVPLSADLADQLKQRVPTVNYAMPVLNTSGSFRWRNTRLKSVPVMGVTAAYPQVRSQQVVRGHFFTDLHVQNRIHVAVVGMSLAQNVFRGLNPVGEHIYLNNQEYTVMGVLPARGQGMADNVDNAVLVPLTDAQDMTGSYNVDAIWLKASNARVVDATAAQVSRIITRTLHLDLQGSGGAGGPASTSGQASQAAGGSTAASSSASGSTSASGGGASGRNSSGSSSGSSQPGQNAASNSPVTVTSLNDWVQQADQANRVMTLLLAAIAGVSLLVGGLGIMNIMLVSVSERTSEIGLRKALGATPGIILYQFLLEALLMSVAGGILGAAAGVGAAQLLTHYGFETVVTVRSLVVAFAAATGTGIVFGVYPALGAAAMTPVEALRKR